MGQDSVVGIVTRYGLESPGIEYRNKGEIFPTRPDRPWSPTQPRIQWISGHSWG